MSYFVLDEGRVHPLAQHNTLSTIIQLERAPNAEQLAVALAQARELFASAEQSSLQQALLAWLKSVVLKRVAPEQNFPEFSQLQEVHTMLAETVTQWTQQWLEEGRQKGLQEGKQEGRQETLHKAVSALAQHGLSVTEIAQALELGELEVRRMLA